MWLPRFFVHLVLYTIIFLHGITQYSVEKDATVQLTTRTTEDGIPELTRIPEKIATTEHFIILAR